MIELEKNREEVGRLGREDGEVRAEDGIFLKKLSRREIEFRVQC